MQTTHQHASETVLGQRSEIAATLVEREFARHPELAERYGKTGREKSLQDVGYHLSFLAQALAVNNHLGANTPHSSVVATLIERQADVLAVSATISYHVDAVRDLISAVRADPGCRRVRILAGGYPFNHDPDLWRKVGADGSASDAQQAILLADQIVNETGS